MREGESDRMLVATLAIVGLVKLATFASLLLVGRALLARRASSTYARVASNAFVAWWWGIAAYMLIQGATEILAFAGIATLPEIKIVRIIEIPIDAVAVWGIVTYVLMLLFDTPRVPWSAAAYSIIATVVYVIEALHDPQAVSVSPWSVGLAPTSPTTFYAIASALFGVPLVLATLAYAALLFRVTVPIQRYRIGLVSTGLFSWVVGGVLTTIPGNGWGTFVGVSGLGIVAACAVLAAYHPPRWILEKLAPHDPLTLLKQREAQEKRKRGRERIDQLI